MFDTTILDLAVDCRASPTDSRWLLPTAEVYQPIGILQQVPVSHHGGAIPNSAPVLIAPEREPRQHGLPK